MSADDPCNRGQTQFSEGLSYCSEEQKRAELSLLFNDLVTVARGSELEHPLRLAFEDLRRRKEREHEIGPNIEQALKAAVG